MRHDAAWIFGAICPERDTGVALVLPEATVPAMQALIDRLRNLDAELLRQARSRLDEPTRAALAREADEELAAFRAVMPADAFARAREAAIDRLVRERFALPTVAFVG